MPDLIGHQSMTTEKQKRHLTWAEMPLECFEIHMNGNCKAKLRIKMIPARRKQEKRSRSRCNSPPGCPKPSAREGRRGRNKCRPPPAHSCVNCSVSFQLPGICVSPWFTFQEFSRYMISFPFLRAYSISFRVLSPIYPPGLMT